MALTDCVIGLRYSELLARRTVFIEFLRFRCPAPCRLGVARFITKVYSAAWTAGGSLILLWSQRFGCRTFSIPSCFIMNMVKCLGLCYPQAGRLNTHGLLAY